VNAMGQNKNKNIHIDKHNYYNILIRHVNGSSKISSLIGTL